MLTSVQILTEEPFLTSFRWRLNRTFLLGMANRYYDCFNDMFRDNFGILDELVGDTLK